jgi:hypothetical protein
VAVVDGNINRKPKSYVEIKNVSPADRWVGLTAEQFKTILKSKIVGENPDKVFVVCASLISKNLDKDGDLLGVYLKTRFTDKQTSKFADFRDLIVRIQYVFTGEELKNKGTPFNQNSYLYETEIFQEVPDRSATKILDPANKTTYKTVECKGGVLPVIMRDKIDKPKEFGEFSFKGDIAVYIKKNEKSSRMYVHCKTNTQVKNGVLGIFNLEKGKVYDTFFATVGANPTLKRNNIWIARRNLENISSSSPKSRIAEIAKKI